MASAVTPAPPTPRWGVIRDARRRQRRRRLLVGAITALSAAAVGSLLANVSTTGQPAAGPRNGTSTVWWPRPSGLVLGTTTLRGDLWVLSCTRACSTIGPASGASGELTELAPNSGRVLRRVLVADPAVLTSGGGAIWIAHFHSGRVTRVDPRTGRTTATVDLQLPNGFASTPKWTRFQPSGIDFGDGQVWASTAFGYLAQINAGTARLVRVIQTGSEATSAATAAGRTWIADELSGIGTFPTTTTRVARHQITWAGQPLDITTVAHGAGLIWALGSATNVAASLTNPPTTSVVTTISPRTGRIVHQWRVPNTATMVLAGGSAYVGDDRDGRLLHLIPPNRTQVLHGPRASTLTAATAHALWATTSTRLLRIALNRH